MDERQVRRSLQEFAQVDTTTNRWVASDGSLDHDPGVNWWSLVGAHVFDDVDGMDGALTPLPDARGMTDGCDEIMRVSGFTADTRNPEGLARRFEPEMISFAELLFGDSHSDLFARRAKQGHYDLVVVSEVEISPELEAMPDVVQALFLSAIATPARRAGAVAAMASALPESLLFGQQWQWQRFDQSTAADSGIAVLHYPTVDTDAVISGVLKS